MILEIRPLAAGNALQVSLKPPAGATLCRLLRKPTDDFTGEADAAALVAYEGLERVVVDAEPGLINLVPMFYKPYYRVDAAWVTSASRSGTPQATYADRSTDVQALVRNRLEAGLAVEVARGTFSLQGHTAIPVLTAPPVAEQTMWPVVTVQLVSEAPQSRGVGEVLADDTVDPLSLDWLETDGWLADVTLQISGWSLNPDERLELRKALRRILVANLGVFDAAGMVEITPRASDEDFLNGEFSTNVFQTSVSLNCQAPVIVTNAQQPITDVEVGVIADIAPVFN